MLDYRRIAMATAGGGLRHFRPEDSAALHARARTWLSKMLARPRQGRARVVITHHLPCWHSVSPAFAAAASNPAFASDLDDCLPQADLWVHGHTHSSHDYLVAGCRVISNPRGYPMRRGGFENPRFLDDRRVSL
jgi:hypothetical protein